MNSSSTLVATVSINYEDFTEGFLTCGTCLCAYDQAEHTPKLLSCSHTICQSCLELIASSPTLNNSTEAGCIKCPICRQNIAIPNGGIGALPPSFLVNQLYDLVNKKPREFIPKCSIHIEQELLFCETCDCVFCDTCNNCNESDDSLTTSSLTTTTTATATTTTATTTTSATSTYISNNITNTLARQSLQNKQHISEVCTVIPFSTAIKRMSEILNYRSQQCLGKLDDAKQNVQKEIDKLESNCTDAIEDIGIAFEKIKTIIEEREKQLLEEARKLHEYKKNVLLEQLKTIENEKASLNINSSVKVNNETDVKNLSKKISDLTEKNDIALALHIPRENCFICFENENNNQALNSLQDSINDFGKIRTSKTYPPYCTSRLIRYSTNLRSTAIVQSIDYNGLQQKFGGDPIHAELKLIGVNEDIDASILITDNRNGTYEVAFVPPLPGKYQLYIYIFNRPIKDCPLIFETNSHHNPVAIFGISSKKSVADQFDHFSQPASLTINKHNGRVYILDSFNNRIKILAQINSPECPFSFMQHIQQDFLGRSCTGIALLYHKDDNGNEENAIQNLSLTPNKRPNPTILVTDWRNRMIYEFNNDGKLIRQFTHDDLLEPTSIVVDSKGRIFVLDRQSIFIFNSIGKFIYKLTGYKYTKQIETNAIGLQKIDSFITPQKVPPTISEQQQQQLNHSGTNLLSTVNNQDQNKENQGKTLANSNTTNTLNTYLINAASNEKRANAKTNTLSSFMSIKRKPKLNSGSSLQKGSKAVISAASRIRSTFTLSHSTSLVSAASLQSMFNSNKNSTMNNLNNGQFDSQSISLNDDHHQQSINNSSNNANKLKASTNKLDKQQLRNNINESIINQTMPINEQHEDEANMISNQNNVIDLSGANKDDAIEPFGIIRGIAIGPNDELIIADESRVRELQSGDEYVFKRELLVQNRSVHPSSGKGGRICSMTFDGQSRLLLTLNASHNGGCPFIQIVDYATGKVKFNIDSFDSKLIRPSCLATYEQHVIVTDLGNDCIKKYRFY